MNGVKERVIRARICPAVLQLPSTVDVVGCKPVALNTVYLWQLLTWGMEPSITKCHGCTQVKPSLRGQPTSSVTYCAHLQEHTTAEGSAGQATLSFRLLCRFLPTSFFVSFNYAGLHTCTINSQFCLNGNVVIMVVCRSENKTLLEWWWVLEPALSCNYGINLMRRHI